MSQPPHVVFEVMQVLFHTTVLGSLNTKLCSLCDELHECRVCESSVRYDYYQSLLQQAWPLEMTAMFVTTGCNEMFDVFHRIHQREHCLIKQISPQCFQALYEIQMQIQLIISSPRLSSHIGEEDIENSQNSTTLPKIVI